MRLAGRMVVEQALRDVQQLVLRDPGLGQARQQIVEIAQVGLVRADLLGGEDMVEFDAEPPLLPAKLGRSTLDRMISWKCCLR